MNFKHYQDSATDLALETAYKPEYLIPGLVAEAGEVAGKYAKYVRDVAQDVQPKNTSAYAALRDGLAAELGDVLWFLAVTCDFFQLSLEDVAAANIEKLKGRASRGTISGSGDNR
jgi:NTP pyrophosphatase (non-canonical NTP hydrolase)